MKEGGAKHLPKASKNQIASGILDIILSEIESS